MKKKKIKILHVAQAAGGVDRYIRMLLKYLDKEKFENILVCSQDFREKDYKNLVDFFEQVKMDRAIGSNDLKAIGEVRRLIKRYNPDIVYIACKLKKLATGDSRPIRQSFKHRSSLSGMPLPLPVRKQSRMKIFKTSCRMNTTFSSKHNVGVTAICRRNGTSLYRSVLWGIAAKENVWKDSLFRTPRRICGTRKTPY